MNSEMEDRLRAVIQERTSEDVSRVSLDDDLVEELGLDSLAGLQMLALTEKRFDIRFPNQRLSELRTLRSILEEIEQ